MILQFCNGNSNTIAAVTWLFVSLADSDQSSGRWWPEQKYGRNPGHPLLEQCHCPSPTSLCPVFSASTPYSSSPCSANVQLSDWFNLVIHQPIYLLINEWSNKLINSLWYCSGCEPSVQPTLDMDYNPKFSKLPGCNLYLKQQTPSNWTQTVCILNMNTPSGTVAGDCRSERCSARGQEMMCQCSVLDAASVQVRHTCS